MSSDRAAPQAGKQAATRPFLQFNHVEKLFSRRGKVVQALSNTAFEIPEGQFLTVVGPSGCGKSTMLNLIGGFDTPTSGSVLLDGDSVNGPGRDRGMVFQTATLFPWKTVEANVAWPMLVGGTPKKAALERSRELLALVGLSGFATSYPGELSGGMRQRAAIARTLGLEPKMLLMDEPFGALDAQTRELMQEELSRIWQASGITVVFITHDINEAIFLGDRCLVMSARPGRVIADIEIELDRPRGEATKRDPRMADYHAELWHLLRSEVDAAAARDKAQAS